MQKIAMNTLIEIYALEGDQVLKEVCRYEIPASKLKRLKNSFDAIDSGTWSRSRVRSHKRRSLLLYTLLIEICKILISLLHSKNGLLIVLLPQFYDKQLYLFVMLHQILALTSTLKPFYSFQL